MSDIPELRLTDDGLEAPEHLVGRTGQIKVEKPDITMTLSYTGDGVRKVDPELVTFPPTGADSTDVPEGHVRIQGTLYRIRDDRDLSECPHCGSDKVSACDDPSKCYTCDTVLEEVPA